AFLRDVCAEYLAQGCMQEVRRGMVEYGRLPRRGIDGGRYDCPFFRCARLDLADMQVGIAELSCIHDPKARRAARELADIPDLAAGFGIERRAVEDDLDGLAAACRRNLDT